MAVTVDFARHSLMMDWYGSPYPSAGLFYGLTIMFYFPTRQIIYYLPTPKGETESALMQTTNGKKQVYNKALHL